MILLLHGRHHLAGMLELIRFFHAVHEETFNDVAGKARAVNTRAVILQI
jgi:hypothetical protein